MTKQALRECLLRLLGIPAGRVELKAEKRGEVDLGEVVSEKWLYTAELGSRIPANLYRPRAVQGRLPGAVMTCGHGDSKGVPHMAYVAQVYARAGLACLVADPLGEEERHKEGKIGTRCHDLPDSAYRGELAGRSVMGKFVFDAMRGLDFLESLPWVDSRRMAAAGNSLGGAVAGWLFALEKRLRATIVSGWAFSDYLCRWSKHCTRVPNQKLRAVCTWPEFLALGHGALLVMNGDNDPVIDHDASGTVWRDTAAHLAAAEGAGERLATWTCPGGGHRPYHGTKAALAFLRKHLGARPSPSFLAAVPELNYGQWCDRYGVTLERLYGTEQHYRGTVLPDLDLRPIARQDLAVLRSQEIGGNDFTIDGWLSSIA